ncbi:MAG: DUF3048 C-terminal domain-containing protein [Eubacteriales bacterium]|nr:DUF3048 C-terminal domain-containing protein [Eubacteriales bacterium]
MKKILSILLVLTLCLTSVATLAQGTTIANEADRNIKGKNKVADGTYSENPIIDGKSPTTGLDWNGIGDYQPMLVQIDTTDGGVGVRSPWGAEYADIIYETPLYKQGQTRMSFLFSDYIPASAGPVRSARVGHAWLREEWDAGFLFFGSQELKGSSVSSVFKTTGANKKGVIFSGIVGAGKPWAKFYNRAPGLKSPSNMDANVKEIRNLIPKSHVAIPHPFLFSDELPTMGETATQIHVENKHKQYISDFEYNASENTYYRSVAGQPFENRDFETLETKPIPIKNIIVQRTKVGWNDGNGVAPLTEHIGKGNADIFIGGKYIAGYWERPNYQSRTVYMDQDGNEIQLQRGKTFILVTQYETPVSYK